MMWWAHGAKSAMCVKCSSCQVEWRLLTRFLTCLSHTRPRNSPQSPGPHVCPLCTVKVRGWVHESTQYFDYYIESLQTMLLRCFKLIHAKQLGIVHWRGFSSVQGIYATVARHYTFGDPSSVVKYYADEDQMTMF